MLDRFREAGDPRRHGFGRMGWRALLPVAVVILGTAALAGTDERVPSEYGTTIFHRSGEPGKHIYIIAQSHRSAITGANGPVTVSAQMEVYQISEWLIRNRDVGLLLPEAFFDRLSSDQETSAKGEGERRPEGPAKTGWLDNSVLKLRLSDSLSHTSAERLLQESCDIKLRQVEQRELYLQAIRLLSSGVRGEGLAGASFAELRYVQEKRTAVMLQNASDVIEEEYAQEHIRNQQAIFTIGMAHIPEIIRFLTKGQIEVRPLSPSPACADYVTQLGLLEKRYGISILLPRSLSENREALQMTRLQRVVPQ